MQSGREQDGVFAELVWQQSLFKNTFAFKPKTAHLVQLQGL